MQANSLKCWTPLVLFYSHAKSQENTTPNQTHLQSNHYMPLPHNLQSRYVATLTIKEFQLRKSFSKQRITSWGNKATKYGISYLDDGYIDMITCIIDMFNLFKIVLSSQISSAIPHHHIASYRLIPYDIIPHHIVPYHTIKHNIIIICKKHSTK